MIRHFKLSAPQTEVKPMGNLKSGHIKTNPRLRIIIQVQVDC